MWTSYHFTLVLDNQRFLSPDVSEALVKAGCEDAKIFMKEGKVHVQFDRIANSFQTAMRTARGDINRAGFMICDPVESKS